MKSHKLFLVFFMLLATSFMSFRPFTDDPRSPILMQVFGIILLLYCLSTIFSRRYNELIFRKGNIWVLCSFVMSMVSSYILYDQALYQSLKATSTWIFCLCLYFLCVKWSIEDDFIIKFLLLFSVFFTAAEIIQQFTYPNLLFNGRPANEITGDVEKRMGIWRTYIFGVDYCILACLFCFQKVLEKSPKYIWLFIITFFGVIFFVARKNIFALVSCFIVGVVFGSKRASGFAKILIGVFIIAIFAILPSYMTELLDQTSNEIGNEDFIRYMAADYFIHDFNDSPLYVLFGSGLAGDSQLSKEFARLQEVYHYFQSDCGFVGYYSYFGLLGIGAMIYLIIRIIANYKFIDKYLLLYLLLRIEIAFFDFWGNYPRNLAAWFIYLYLIECSIHKNKQTNSSYLKQIAKA